MASVYTNDLRLEEIGTGEQSGTWGTTTNTNLELIAEAFGFGTEAITTNADTHTTTIADGSTDPGRSIFLKYTGSLDSACTITLGPNTVSKLWFIENATSGSQNIIISQGSGANVTIAAGQTKAVYSDGAGSGAAIVDALQDLAIPDLFIDDDLTLQSDGAVLNFGADSDISLTHVADTALLMTGAGSTTGITINNTATDGDPFLSFALSGTSAFTMGVDDGDGDSFKIGTTAIGTNTRLTISSGGVVSISATTASSSSTSGALTVAGGAGVAADLSVGDDLRLDSDSAVLSIGADADLQITHDGTNGDFQSAGTLTFDVASDIKFDAGTGGERLLISNTTGDIIIRTADRWIYGNGTSGGTTIDAGIRFETSTPKLEFWVNDGERASISSDGDLTVGDDLLLASDSAVLSIGADADLKITHDGSNGDFESAGTLTFDVASEIVLDADGGVWRFKDAGTEILNIANDSSDVHFNAKVADKDILFRGIDGSSTITALKLDFSAAGAATFGAAGGNATAIIQGSSGAGSTNQPGTDLQLKGGAGGGTGGSNMKFFTAPGGTSGTSESAAVERVQINNNGDVRIYSSAANVGRLGLAVDGTTLASVNDSTGVAVVQLGQASFLTQFDFDGVGSVHLANNVYYNGTNLIAPFAGAASDFYQSGGGHYFRTRASGSAGSMSLTERLNIDVNGNFNFNDQSNNQDFRVESDAHAGALYVDGGTDGVGINSTAPVSYASGQTVLFIEDTVNPAIGISDTGQTYDYWIYANGNKLGIDYAEGGGSGSVANSTAMLHLHNDADGVVFNEGGADRNFRIEGDSNANLFLLDAGTDTIGIGTTQMNAVGNNVAGINFLGDGQGNFSRDGGTVLRINRKQDGDLVDFRSAAQIEGTISISGSTTTYGGFSGQHETSGIATNTAIGTVVSTIDELDTYVSGPKTGQVRIDHAKVKVSDSVGDPSVYGVLAKFDGDEKAYVNSVGIGSVRVTGACSNGDLLESNGDGTAKVQSDDIVRSKTIGKVTIGNSDSGVKLVSCVLYCG